MPHKASKRDTSASKNPQGVVPTAPWLSPGQSRDCLQENWGCMFCLTEWSLMRFIGRKSNKIYNLGETKHFQGGGQNCWEFWEQDWAPQVKEPVIYGFQNCWMPVIALCLLFPYSLNEHAQCIDLTPVLSVYAVFVCVYVVGLWYIFHFSSQVFILRATVSENYIKGALSALDPYLLYFLNLFMYLFTGPTPRRVGS